MKEVALSCNDAYNAKTRSGGAEVRQLASQNQQKATPPAAVSARIDALEAYVQVISHGYNGMGFQQPPGGQGPGSPFEAVTVQATPPPCAVPKNFHQDSVNQDEVNGILTFVYKWGSSSGNMSDLFACRIGERVTYPIRQTPTSPRTRSPMASCLRIRP